MGDYATANLHLTQLASRLLAVIETEEVGMCDGEFAETMKKRARQFLKAARVRRCRLCGCTEEDACKATASSPCAWATPRNLGVDDLCTACRPRAAQYDRQRELMDREGGANG